MAQHAAEDQNVKIHLNLPKIADFIVQHAKVQVKWLFTAHSPPKLPIKLHFCILSAVLGHLRLNKLHFYILFLESYGKAYEKGRQSE
ncbi:hypothetical protein [Paenibacillus sp. NPDC058174]|uniref:hypothetical protein n=1 Tax=Paenibacillus sp. NPDC058174 TaxID=3346366 RepID=UPI0036D8897C